MKKGAITSLVFTCITFVLGIVAIILSFRSALSPVSIEHFSQGFALRMSFSSSFGVAISSISVMTMIFGCSLLIISIILLCLTIRLFYWANNDNVIKETVKDRVVDKKEVKQVVGVQESEETK